MCFSRVGPGSSNFSEESFASVGASIQSPDHGRRVGSLHGGAWLQSAVWSARAARRPVNPGPSPVPATSPCVPSPTCVFTHFLRRTVHTVFQTHPPTPPSRLLLLPVSVYTSFPLRTQPPPSICCSSSQDRWVVHLLSSFPSFSSSYCHCRGSREVLFTTCPSHRAPHRGRSTCG